MSKLSELLAKLRRATWRAQSAVEEVEETADEIIDELKKADPPPEE